MKMQNLTFCYKSFQESSHKKAEIVPDPDFIPSHFRCLVLSLIYNCAVYAPFEIKKTNVKNNFVIYEFYY